MSTVYFVLSRPSPCGGRHAWQPPSRFGSSAPGTSFQPDSYGEASPRVGVGNGEFYPLPMGNRAGNDHKGFSFVSLYYLSKRWPCLVTLSILSLYINICFDDLSISRCETWFEWVILTFDLDFEWNCPRGLHKLNLCMGTKSWRHEGKGKGIIVFQAQLI